MSVVWKVKALIYTYKCVGSVSFNFPSYPTPLFLEAERVKAQALHKILFFKS